MQKHTENDPSQILDPAHEHSRSAQFPLRLRNILHLLGVKHPESSQSSHPSLEIRQEKKFTPDTIIHPAQPEGGRGLATYESHLLIDRHNLEGKRVLDLGSGPEVKFAKELEEAGITAKVTSVSPDYSSSEHAQRAVESHNHNLVAAVGEALPFPDESFDEIVALFTHVHVKDPEKFIEELSRVLSPGGEARLGIDLPVSSLYEYVTTNEELMRKLGVSGVHIERKPVPREVFETKTIDPLTGDRLVVGGNVVVLTKDVTEPA